jgi:hypothetical protein
MAALPIGKVDPDRVARDIGFARQRIDFGLGQARASKAARCRDRACPPRSSPCRARRDALGERHQGFPHALPSCATCMSCRRDRHRDRPHLAFGGVAGQPGLGLASLATGGDLGILAFAGKQRQVDADPNRDHVAIGRIAPAIARVLTRQSGRLSARASSVSASAPATRRRAPCRRGSSGMPANQLSRSTQALGGSPATSASGSPVKRASRALALATSAASALRRSLTSGAQLCRVRAPARGAPSPRQAGPTRSPADRRGFRSRWCKLHQPTLGIIEIDPRQRRLQPDVLHFDRKPPSATPMSACGAGALRTALGRIGERLLDPDARHRHALAGEAEGGRSRDGEIVEPDVEV